MSVGHVIYLHGFASSPQSSKARRFAQELAQLGIGYSCPDLNEPDFASLTVTRMLDQTRAAAASARGPLALIGSSLGAYVAVHAAHDAALRGRIARLILLAPALDFGHEGQHKLGEQGLDEWRRAGTLRVFHHAHHRPYDVGIALHEDAAGYDAFAVTPAMPTLVFQGTRDDAVDPAMVRSWCAARPDVDLRLLDDEHQLTASTDLIWRESATFLGVGPGLSHPPR